MTSSPLLPFDDEDRESAIRNPQSGIETPDLPDAAARRIAVDPAHNVILEASAGTGKTRVLVERYVNLLRAGVEPDHILAITFTRKAAAEMRQRIIDRLKEASRLSEFDAARWRDLKERLGDIAVSTIDAFCLSLLREFPLEADVDPGFDLADATEVPRLIGESLDQAFRICRGRAVDDEDVALVFAQLGERRLRAGIAALLDRRLVAPHALRRFLQKGPRDLTAAVASEHAAAAMREILNGVKGGLDAFLNDGPIHAPQFAMLADDMRELAAVHPSTGSACPEPVEGRDPQPAMLRAYLDRLRAYFLTQDGKPRSANFTGTGFNAADCRSPDAWKRHRAEAAQIAPLVARAIRDFRRDLNAIMSRGVWRIFAIALRQYQHTLDAHALLDFSGVLERAVQLLKDMDEFAESRLRLEARHRHVLVDEFQDTSRAQWELVLQLVKSWGEGFGAAADAIPPSIFIVGDRKQSIYGFRDADVAMVDEAAAFVEALRPDGLKPQAITVSFRSAPEILAFVNDVFAAIEGAATPRRDAFPLRRARSVSGPSSRPPPRSTRMTDESPLGVHRRATRCGPRRIASRTKSSGCCRARRCAIVPRASRARRSRRTSPSCFDRETATATSKRRSIAAASPPTSTRGSASSTRTKSRTRSRCCAISPIRCRICGSRRSCARASCGCPTMAWRGLPASGVRSERRSRGRNVEALGDEDRRVLDRLRRAVPRWLSWVDRLAPSELLDAVLHETAYAYELRGSRRRQARENLKKLRGMIRRAQNRGYATLSRIADHLERLAVGDESNAAIDAIDAVSLMTVHAAKGLEFPIVFVVNMGRGTGGPRAPIRVTDDVAGEASVAIADYQSEADEDQSAREREESKRLLYVALTRARERLYLSATVKDGGCRMGKFKAGLGSLGEACCRADRSSGSARDFDRPSADQPRGTPSHAIAPPAATFTTLPTRFRR